MDSLQECCHCNDTTVVITSIDLVNDLLTSLEQLINSSDVSMLNVESSPSGSTQAEVDIGISKLSVLVLLKHSVQLILLYGCWFDTDV